MDPMPIDVQVVCPHIDPDNTASLQRARDVLDELAGYGANWTVVHLDGSSRTRQSILSRPSAKS